MIAAGNNDGGRPRLRAVGDFTAGIGIMGGVMLRALAADAAHRQAGDDSPPDAGPVDVYKRQVPGLPRDSPARRKWNGTAVFARLYPVKASSHGLSLIHISTGNSRTSRTGSPGIPYSCSEHWPHSWFPGPRKR